MDFLTKLWELTVEALTKTFETFGTAIPKILGALIILLVGWIVARIISRVVRKALELAKADKLADKLDDIDLISKSNVKIVPSKIISKFVYWMIFLFFLIPSADALGVDAVTGMVEKLISYIPKLLIASIVLALGLLLANFIKDILKTALDSMGVAGSNVISNIVFYFFFITIALSALQVAEIPMEFLTDNLKLILGGTVLAFAIGYGFASKDIMGNLLGALYSRNKFQKGDVISVNGTKGQIVEMDATSLTIQSENNTRVVVPMGQLSGSSVEKF